MFAGLAWNPVMMEADESLQQEDAQEPPDHPPDDGNQCCMGLSTRVHADFKGSRQHVEHADTDHDARDETQGDLHAAMRQADQQRQQTAKDRCREDQEQEQDEGEGHLEPDMIPPIRSHRAASMLTTMSTLLVILLFLAASSPFWGGRRLPILMYHKVAPENPTIWWVTVDQFWNQMQELSSYQVVSLDDYDPKDPTHVVITFDGL